MDEKMWYAIFLILSLDNNKTSSCYTGQLCEDESLDGISPVIVLITNCPNQIIAMLHLDSQIFTNITDR